MSLVKVHLMLILFLIWIPFVFEFLAIIYIEHLIEHDLLIFKTLIFPLCTLIAAAIMPAYKAIEETPA